MVGNRWTVGSRRKVGSRWRMGQQHYSAAARQQSQQWSQRQSQADRVGEAREPEQPVTWQKREDTAVAIERARCQTVSGKFLSSD